MNQTTTFQTNNYVVLRNLLNKSTCDELTRLLFKLREINCFKFDEQCPISYSFYGVLDDLLPKFQEPFSDILNLDLLPTYSYTRIYRYGEELATHTDRPSCQYSATLCLGMSDTKKNWPIYMGKSKLYLGVGDGCLYKGTDIEHGRDTCEIEWMSQTFLHYVDANGPYADSIYDKRNGLNERLYKHE